MTSVEVALTDFQVSAGTNYKCLYQDGTSKFPRQRKGTRSRHQENPDALVSSLFIKYVDAAGVPLSVFDDLFTLFRHADFRADSDTPKV